MKAFIKTRYGGPEVLRLEEIEKPVPADDEVLIKVMANSANPADWHILRGEPILARFAFGLLKPKTKILGADFSGIVEATGKDITAFKIGDRVFGESLKGGAFAEHTCVKENLCAKMPPGATFEEMAGMPIAGLTALQSLTEHGKLKSGESVLINGSSGGVGHLTVQIAKSLGANVTGVCSSSSGPFVKSLGADRVIAYDLENIHQHKGKYDLVVDTNGNLDFDDFTRMGNRAVAVGFTSLSHMASVSLKNAFSKFPMTQFTAAASRQDLETLASLVRDKKVKVHIEKTFAYQQIPDAIGYIESMRTKGKVIMTWNV